MYKYGHRARGHPNIKQLLAFLLALIMLVATTSPDLAKADSIEHTHIWATKYDDKNHWEYCTVYGEKRNVTAHVFTDHWVYGYESCNWANPSTRTCSCGYSYIYHKPHSGTYITNSHTYYERQHWLQCSKCGDSVNNIACYDDEGLLTCSNPGTCKVCGGISPANHHQINSQGICVMCKKKFFTIADSSYTYSNDYSCVNWSFRVIPVDSTVKVTGTTTWCAPGTCSKKSGQIVQNDDGSYTVKITLNILYSKNTAIAGWSYDNITINGALSWVNNVVVISGFYRDHTAPDLTSITQTDQASANGWATIKQLTFEGTEDFSDIVYLTISDKLTGEKYVTDAAVPVTDGKYSYVCTPSIEGDANGRTYIVTAKDTNGNLSTKEFVISKTDGSAPQLKNGTSLTYTDWTTSKDISLSFFDFGSGGVKAGLDNQTDYKPLAKSGEYYVWNHSFGNQVGTSEHTIYVKDALGNATSYKLTVGNTDSNVYSISYNLNGGAMSGQKTSYTVVDSFTLPTPTKTGYTFTGWTGSNGTAPQMTVTVNKGTRGNLSYTANWSANNYYVTFNGNGGSLNVMDGSIAKNNNGTATAKVQYDLNYYYSLGILATKPGFTFKGFYDAPSGGTQVFRVDGTTRCLSVASKYYNENNIWKYAGNVTLYAQWKPITWTVKYDANGGTGTMADSKHVYESGSKLNQNQFSKTGYTFNGWQASRVRDGKTEWLCANTDNSWIDGNEWYEKDKIPSGRKIFYFYDCQIMQISTYIDGDVITMHALWNVNTYTNQIGHWAEGFKYREGDNDNKNALRLKDTYFSASYKSNIVMDSAKAVKIPNGYYLRGLGTPEVDGTFKAYSIGLKLIQKPASMRFEYYYDPISYSITYNLNGGTNNNANPSTYTVLYGVSLKAPTRTGYIFTGWYDENGNKITGINEGCNATFSSVDDLYAKLAARTTGNRVLTAHWSYNPVSVKVPQILIGDHTGKSQFRIKCDDFKAGSIKITVPNSFLYKQIGKADVAATITAKSGNNIITPTNKICVYNITTINGLSAGNWNGNFNIGLTLTKE